MKNRGERNEVAQADALLVAGRYAVLEELERPGGLAGYRVRHVLLDSMLLLTALPAEVGRDPSRLARARAAIRAAGRLRHDHIVPVLDLVEDDGRYFIVEPLAEGVPLDRVIDASPLDATDALHVARQLADALAYAHAAGVVHGTVCPANVLVEIGATTRACLSGFVLAALAEPEAPIPVRFLRYTPPERLTGVEADARGDVFALGQMLFELFEGRPLLRGNREAVETLLRDGTAPFLPRFSRGVPGGVAGLVARTIRRAPAERQQEMAHVRADLDVCLRSIGEPMTETADGPIERSSVEAAGPVTTGAARPGPVLRPPVARRGAAARPVPAMTVSHRRIPWPARERREASFPSRVLVRASSPRTPLRSKLLAIVAMFALVWALPFALPPAPPPAAGRPAVIAAPEAAIAGPPSDDVVAAAEPARVEPPHIEGYEPPADRLTMAAGETTWFRVWAAGSEEDQRLQTWLLDGRKVADGPEWRMVAPSLPHASMHAVEVEVAEGAGVVTARRGWSVVVDAARTIPRRPAPGRPTQPRR